MTTNNNSVAPMGAIQGSVDLNEVSHSGRVKRTDVQLLPHGINLGIIYGFVDLGTHMETFPGSAPKLTRKLKFLFEHPQMKQLFYEYDTVQKSTVSSKDCTFSVNEKSFLKKVIDSISMRITPIEEASKYNPANLIGQRIGVNIVHTPKQKDPTSFYEKVENVMSANGLAVPHPFEPENKPMYFFIDKAGNNFTSQNFADLPKYFRDKIMESQEGKAHIAKGGKFAENPKQENGAQQQQFQQQQPQQQQFQQQQGNQGLAQQAPVNVSPITMIATAPFTREQYHASGWTDAQLLQQGLAVPNAPAQPAAPQMPQSPSAPAGPQAPPQGPSAPQAQQQQQFAPQGQQAPPSFLNGGGEEHDDLPF